MAGYYGIADFAGDFNKVRDDALDSGFKAKQQMRNDWLGDYKMPGEMLGADADALSNGIKNDTLDQGYDSMVQYGVNTADLNAQKSGINLDKLAADETMTQKTNEARAAGIVNPSDVANTFGPTSRQSNWPILISAKRYSIRSSRQPSKR